MKAEQSTGFWRAGAITATFASLMFTAGAGAQTSASEGPSATAENSAAATAPVAVEEKKIDQFADAFIAVQTIQAQATQELSATTDETKAQAVKEAAETQMIEAVQRTGLQIDEFNLIVQAMASDTALRDRVSGRIVERKRTS